MKQLLFGALIYSYGNEIYSLIKILNKMISIIQTSYNTYKYISRCKCGICEYNRKHNLKELH